MWLLFGDMLGDMVDSSAPAMQRAASLMLLPGLLSELGTTLGDVLSGTGISADMLRPDCFIPYATYLDILDRSARLTGRDDIGLLLGRRQTLAALGPVGRVMRHAGTLREALNDFVSLQIGNSTGGSVYLIRADRDLLLGYGIYDPAMHASPHIHDMVVAVGCNLLAELTGGSVEAAEILSSREAPSDLTPYVGLGRCPIRFGQSQTGLVLRTADLTLPLPDANRTLHDQTLAEFYPRIAEAQSDTRGLVRHVLRELLLTGSSGMDEVAARLGMHPRSLRRKLRVQQATFEAIKDEVRHTIARELLALGAQDITDISITLDYSSASSFVHAFHRWTGTSPAAWRQRNKFKGENSS